MGSKEINMLKIDVHNHIMPSKMPDFKSQLGRGGFITLKHRPDGKADMVRDDGKFFRTVNRNCFDPEARLQEMEQFGTDVQVLSTIPVLFSEWAEPKQTHKVNRFLNEDLAEVCKKYPKKFLGLATVPLNDSKLAAEELKYATRDLGLAGVQIGSHYGELNLNDEELFPFYEMANELETAILVHPWDMMGKETMPKYWLPWLVSMPAETSRAICCVLMGGILDKFPKIKFSFAHGGGSFAHTLARIQHGFEQRPDLCAVDTKKSPREYIGKFYVDSINHSPDALHYNMDVLGVNSIMLGSDYPFPLGELEPGKMISEMDSLTTEQKERLFNGSALEWLGISASRFE